MQCSAQYSKQEENNLFKFISLQVSGLKVSGAETRRLTGAVSDFETTVGCAFASRLLAQHDSGVLVDAAVIEVKNFQCSDVEGVKKIMILDGEVMCKYTGHNLPKLPTQATPSAAASKPLANIPPVSPSECVSLVAPAVIGLFIFCLLPACLVNSTAMLRTSATYCAHKVWSHRARIAAGCQ